MMSLPRLLTGTACLVGVALGGAGLASCSSSSSTPAASASSSGAASSSASASATASGSASSALPAPSYSATPAPSTAGDLTQRSFVVPKGWAPVAVDTTDQGLTPNGTPVHARTPAEVSLTMLQPCGTAPAKAPANPTHDLEMNLKKGSSMGVGELMEFTTAAQAKAWFATFQAQLVACQKSNPGMITKLQQTASVWRGRRNLGSDGNYAEAAVLRGRRIVSYALDDPSKQVDTAALVASVLAH